MHLPHIARGRTPKGALVLALFPRLLREIFAGLNAGRNFLVDRQCASNSILLGLTGECLHRDKQRRNGISRPAKRRSEGAQSDRDGVVDCSGFAPLGFAGAQVGPAASALARSSANWNTSLRAAGRYPQLGHLHSSLSKRPSHATHRFILPSRAKPHFSHSRTIVTYGMRIGFVSTHV